MRVNEVEELLQIPRANIRFYEKEGLLHPKRSGNGYRSYSEEDVAVLKEIIIFRKLGLSVAEIRDVLEGKVSVSEAVSKNIGHLQEQIAELNGALELSKSICTDQWADREFDREKYWRMLLEGEKKGLRFLDIMSDYVAYEKKIFKSIIPCGGVGILLVCALRGLLFKFIFGQSFVFGFLYPLMLFLVISVMILPPFVISAKYKDAEVEEDEGRTGFGWTFLKFVGMVLLFLFLMFGVLKLLGEFWFAYNVGEDIPYIVAGIPAILWFFSGIYLWVEILWLYSKRGIFPTMGEDGIKAHLPKKVKRKVLCISIVLYLVSVFIYGNWYHCVTEKGVVVHHLFIEREYSWEDADHYTLQAVFDGVLKYTVWMKDGTPVVCIGDPVSMGDFDEELVRTLTRKFAEKGVPLKVKDWDKLMKGLKYEHWKEYAKELRDLAGE